MSIDFMPSTKHSCVIAYNDPTKDSRTSEIVTLVAASIIAIIAEVYLLKNYTPLIGLAFAVLIISFDTSIGKFVRNLFLKIFPPSRAEASGESKPQTLKEELVCISYFEVKPEFRDAFITEMLKLVQQTREEEGCIYYELCADKENRDFFILPSKFKNAAALDVHEKKPYITTFLEGPMVKYCSKVTWNEAQEIINL